MIGLNGQHLIIHFILCLFEGDYKKILLEYIEATELPAYLGGDKTDSNGNPRCAEMV